jgi:hypothetical protein
VNGYVTPGFEQVGEVFESNFREHGEIGAAFAAVLDGKPIVDIWAGVADRQSRRPWNEDTLQLVFSGTKGLVATCILILIDRQMLDLEEPVSRYWPEFGKPHILVRDIVAHTARLPGIDERVTVDDLIDDRTLVVAGQVRSQKLPLRIRTDIRQRAHRFAGGAANCRGNYCCPRTRLCEHGVSENHFCTPRAASTASSRRCAAERRPCLFVRTAACVVAAAPRDPIRGARRTLLVRGAPSNSPLWRNSLEPPTRSGKMAKAKPWQRMVHSSLREPPSPSTPCSVASVTI